MANTTGVQYTHAHSTGHVSKQRSEIMKEIRIRVEDGLSSHMSQALQVGIVRRKQKLLITGYICRYECSLRSESQYQGGGESHQTSGIVI